MKQPVCVCAKPNVPCQQQCSECSLTGPLPFHDAAEVDVVDAIEDGVPDYDTFAGAEGADALWSVPRDDCAWDSVEEEAAEVFAELSGSDACDADYRCLHDCVVLPSLGAGDESSDEQAGAGEEGPRKAPKVPKAHKDSATTQNLDVIRCLVEKLQSEGGFEKADVYFVDFESAYAASAQVCAPCEIGMVKCKLTLNNMLCTEERAQVECLHRLEDEVGEGRGCEKTLQELVEQVKQQGTPLSGAHWYHRILHPGRIRPEDMMTALVNHDNLHGLPLCGLSGAATSDRDVLDLFEDVETLCGVPGLRRARREGALRLPPPPSTHGCSALIFAHNPALERTAFSSLAARAEGGPYRWNLPVYDAAHLFQALHLMAGGETLLTARCLEGLGRWLVRGGVRLHHAHPCRYHTFINRRFQKMLGEYQSPDEACEERGFHCALEDAMATAELVREVAGRYFPTIFAGLSEAVRNPSRLSSGEWPQFARRKAATPSIDVDRALADVVAFTNLSLPAFLSQSEWTEEFLPKLQGAITEHIASRNVEAAGCLTLAVDLIDQSAFAAGTSKE